MALPLVPILIVSGLTGVSGLITGLSLSNKLSAALQVTGVVVGLFLIFILAQRFNLGSKLGAT